MLQSVEQMWKNFSDAVMPRDAGLVQRLEMRKCFYAGVRSLLMECREIGEPEITEEDGVAYLERIEREIKEFHKHILKEACL